MTPIRPPAAGLSDVEAVVVAYNEADRIAATVRSLRAVGPLKGITVVDDGSVDATSVEASRAGARVLIAARNVGKGGAFERALHQLPSARAYLLVDADVGQTAAEAIALLEPVLSDELDVAVARLPRFPDGGFGLVKGFARWCIRSCCGFDPHEPLSGQRAMTREALDASRPLAAGFGLEAGMTIDAVRLGFRVREVGVAMRHRPTGRTVGDFVHRGRQGLDVLRAVLPRLAGLR